MNHFKGFAVLLMSLGVHATALLTLPKPSHPPKARAMELTVYQRPAITRREPVQVPVVRTVAPPRSSSRRLAKQSEMPHRQTEVRPLAGLASATIVPGEFKVPEGPPGGPPFNLGKTEEGAPDATDSETLRPPPADTQARVRAEVKVPYPDEARRNGQEGTVRLSLEIDAHGHVVKAIVLSGPGYGLNEAAREALLRFEFTPATHRGENVGATIEYSYAFVFDD